MTLPTFTFLKPQSTAEALAMLAATPNAMPIAGGTNLMVDMRAGKLAPSTVVDLSGLGELKDLEISESHVSIGAGVSIATILDCSAIEQLAPVLHAACQTFANTLIRRRATVGGNLVNAAPCADTAPALLVLDAEVELRSASATRWVPLSKFLLGAFQTQRQPEELMTAVRFAIPPVSSRAGFEKMGLRKISCMAKVDVAVLLDTDDRGECRDARIAHGAASAVALRVGDAEAALIGQPLTRETIDTAARLTQQSAQPRSGSEYKRQVVYGLTRRLLLQAAEIKKESEAI